MLRQRILAFVLFELLASVVLGSDWSPISIAAQAWRCAAMSDSGQYAVAGGDDGLLYYSSNYGANWYLGSSIADDWRGASMSSSGQYVVAVTAQAGIFVSNNYGQSYQNVLTYGWWRTSAMSGSGEVILAYNAFDNHIHRSLNYGLYFTQAAMSDVTCTELALSADGIRAIAYCDSTIMVSSNSGGTWRSITSISGQYAGLATSADGSFAIMGHATEGTTIVSTDFGYTWVSQTTISGILWKKFACDSTGQLVLAASNNRMYMSADFGATFEPEVITDSDDANSYTWYSWTAFAVNGNGGHVVAFEENGAAYQSTSAFPVTTGGGGGSSTSGDDTVAIACGVVFGTLGFAALVYFVYAFFRSQSRTSPFDPNGGQAPQKLAKPYFGRRAAAAAGDPFAPGQSDTGITRIGVKKARLFDRTKNTELVALESQPLPDQGSAAGRNAGGGDAYGGYGGYSVVDRGSALDTDYPLSSTIGTSEALGSGAGGYDAYGGSGGGGGGATIVPLPQHAATSWLPLGGVGGKREF